MSADTSAPLVPDLETMRRRILHRTPREPYPVQTMTYQYRTPVPRRPAPDHPWRNHEIDGKALGALRATQRRRHAVTMIAGGRTREREIPTLRERLRVVRRAQWWAARRGGDR